MSHISFPGETEGSTSQDGQFFGHSGFSDGNSSFQMNPLSSHPPRTPRPSTVTASSHVHIYGGQVYDDKTETGSVADDKEAEEEEATQLSAPTVRRERVIQDMVLTSNGRDKVFKLIQYSIRLYLLFHIPLTRSRFLKKQPRLAWEAELVKRLQSTASGMSFTRKFLLLFNWLAPLTTITAQQTAHLSISSSSKAKDASKTFLQTLLYTPPPVLLELVQAIADDVSTMSLMGLLGKRTGERAGRFADWCWFFATLVGLVENGVERQVMGHRQREVEARLYSESMSGATAKSAGKLSKHDAKELSILHRQSHWLEVTRAKLAMDLIFVSYDIFKIKRGKKSVTTFAGLASAILSFSKLFDRHRTTLAKAKVA